MKRGLSVLLQVVIVLVGVAALALLLWEPHVEGRNAHATTAEIYLHDPFLMFAYTASIAFFVALYKGFRLVGYAGRGEMFSERAVKALRTIRYCALAIVAFVVGAEVYFWIAIRGKDDIAGGVMMGLVMIFVSVVVAMAARVFERRLALKAML